MKLKEKKQKDEISSLDISEKKKCFIIKIKNKFEKFYKDKFDIFSSSEKNYRFRIEFRIFKDENGNLNYAMFNKDKKLFPIKSCELPFKPITDLMEELIVELNSDFELKNKLFAIEFLSTLTQQVLVTLIYHRKINENFDEVARKLENKFGIFIIGRSRKNKRVISKSTLENSFKVSNREFKFIYEENSFSQPNQFMNIKMLEWSLNQIEKIPHQNQIDLLELYCGIGNFTIPLATKFKKVFATEISKNSIKLLEKNCELNNIENVEFARLSSEEFVQAFDEVRDFFRLKNINLKTYNFQVVFVDPPRAGLDEKTIKLVQRFKYIIYISCNPETLARDLEILTKTHQVKRFAIFDQFPYTKHIETGVILWKFN